MPPKDSNYTDILKVAVQFLSLFISITILLMSTFGEDISEMRSTIAEIRKVNATQQVEINRLDKSIDAISQLIIKNFNNN